MAQDTQNSLEALMQAFQGHLDAVKEKQSEEDPNVEKAYYALADAFDEYEDALAREYDEVSPFVVFEEEDDEDEEAAENAESPQPVMYEDDIDFEERA